MAKTVPGANLSNLPTYITVPENASFDPATTSNFRVGNPTPFEIDEAIKKKFPIYASVMNSLELSGHTVPKDLQGPVPKVAVTLDQMLAEPVEPNWQIPGPNPNESVAPKNWEYTYPKTATQYDYIRYECYPFRGITGPSGRENHNAIIRLPMPAELNEQLEAGWTAQDNWIQKGKDVATTVTDAAKSMVFSNGQSGETALKTLKGALGGLGQMAASKIGQEGMINKAIERSLGRVINPMSEQFFTGMSHRTWEFIHKIVPESKDEAAEVNKLIDHFKLAASAVIPKGLQFHLLWPLLWTVKFMLPSGDGDRGKDTENVYLPKLNTCAVTQIQTNYSGAGAWARHADGSPVEIDLTISLTELTIPTAANFVKAEPEISGGISATYGGK